MGCIKSRVLDFESTTKKGANWTTFWFPEHNTAGYPVHALVILFFCLDTQRAAIRWTIIQRIVIRSALACRRSPP